MKKRVTKNRIYLDFSDKDLANQMWLKLAAEQIGFKMTAEKIEEEIFPIVFVTFDNSSRKYTYRLTEELEQIISNNEKERERNWPTRYGLSYGKCDKPVWLTKEEINKIYPFDELCVISRAKEEKKSLLPGKEENIDNPDYDMLTELGLV